MTILYQIEVYDKNEIKYNTEDVIKEVLDIDNEFVKDVVYGVITYKNSLDELANKYMKQWTIDRLGNTDIAIMRMGLFELLYTDTPPVVVINEATDLAKSFSDDKIRKMINGVLDSVYHNEVLKDER